ncbi:hypothetical protein ACH19I_10690 [Yersinia kristensenii]|uniref:hypothetical protein n=1 Tax=Yersinia kristensenii TaxID=28152 RepID=UPI003896C551
MKISDRTISSLNVLIKIVFYTLFYLWNLYLSGFLLDWVMPELGMKLYLSIGGAILCTFIPSMDFMKEVIDKYLMIGNK